MACSLKSVFSVYGSHETIMPSPNKGLYSSIGTGPSQFSDRSSKAFMGESLLVFDVKSSYNWNVKAPSNFSVHAQASYCVSTAQRWWEKTLKPNMIEIHSAQELVDSLVNADDRLVILDFYSPGCGGCRTLHPKICQLAEFNQDAIFLKVNYEELKTMCNCLHIHVLPFFRFYRGGQGRLCSFSCTNATIYKFKDALAKYGGDYCSPGQAKGLDESELMSLASCGEILTKLPSPSFQVDKTEDLILKSMNMSPVKEEKAVLMD